MSESNVPAPGRPVMPEGYGLAAAESFEPITWEWVTGQLEGSRNYWIATTRKSGTPHVSPVWGLWLDGRVMFATDAKSAKGRNALRNPAGSVHLESGDDVVIIDGEFERVTDEELLKKFNTAYEVKYDLNPESGGDEAPVFALNARVVLAWLETDFPKTATRWQFE